MIQEFHDGLLSGAIVLPARAEAADEFEDVELEEEEQPTPVTNKSVSSFCEMLTNNTDDEIFTTPMFNLVRKLQVNLSCLIAPDLLLLFSRMDTFTCCQPNEFLRC